MPLPIAELMADSQIFGMAIAALAQRLNVLQRGGLGCDVLAADPAGHHTVQLARQRLVHLVAGMTETTHRGAPGKEGTQARG